MSASSVPSEGSRLYGYIEVGGTGIFIPSTDSDSDVTEHGEWDDGNLPDYTRSSAVAHHDLRAVISNSDEEEVFVSPDGSIDTVVPTQEDQLLSTSEASLVMERRKRQLEAVFDALDLYEDDFKGWKPADTKPKGRATMLDEAVKTRDVLRGVISYFLANPHNDWTDELATKANDAKKELTEIVKAGRALNDDDSPGNHSINSAGSSNASGLRGERAQRSVPDVIRRADELYTAINELYETQPTSTASLRELDQRFKAISTRKQQIVTDANQVAEDAIAAGDGDTAAEMDNVRLCLSKRLDSAQDFVLRARTKLGFNPHDSLNFVSRVNVKAPKFDGDPANPVDYYTFEARFEEYVETMGIVNLSERALKLRYDCLEGAARVSVEHLSDYAEIMETLKSIFGRASVLFANKAKEIVKLGKCPTDLIKRRNWILSVRGQLISVKQLAKRHKIMFKFDGSSVLSDVQRQMLPRDLDEYRRALRANGSTETMCGADELEILLKFLEILEEWATVDVDQEMRHNRLDDALAASRPGGRGKVEDRQTRRVFHVEDQTSEQKDPTPAPGTILSSHTEIPGKRRCKLCSKNHTHLLYCKEFQKARVKQRWTLVCKTGACIRCMRMDAEFKPEKEQREEWFSQHKPYCSNEFVCTLERCGEKEEFKQNHITLCSFHTTPNKERQQELIATMDRQLVNSGTKFFYAATPVMTIQPGAAIVTAKAQKNEEGVFVEPDVEGVPIYLVQYVASTTNKNERLLVFYDSGCFGAAISDRGYSLTETETVRMGPSTVEVAGGQTIRIPYGDERFWLPLNMETPTVATITALRMAEVSAEFPVWPLQDAWNEIHDNYQKDVGDKFKLPKVEDHIGGSSVDIMLGIRYSKYFPKLIYSLPSGLAIYKSALQSWQGKDGIIGGPRPAWAHALQASNLLTPKVYLTQELRAFFAQSDALYSKMPLLQSEESFLELGAKSNATFCDGCANCDAEILHVGHEIKGFEAVERLGDQCDYRCIKCRNCNDCRKGEELEKVSLQEEREQALIEECVTLDVASQTLTSYLPFTTDPEKALNDNHKIAYKILESQLRLFQRTPEMKLDVSASHDKLVTRGHVIRVEDLSVEAQKDVLTGGYFIPWRTVYKSGSISTPCRMVFDASSKTPNGESLNNILAKGQNKLARLYNLVISFRFGSAAFSADVTMAYNSLKLPTSHYKYQKYLWCDALELGAAVTVMVIVTLIYGVRPSGNLTMAGFDKISHHAELNNPELKLGAEALKNKAYMDDIFSAYADTKTRDEAAQSLSATLAIGGMAVKGFAKSGEQPPVEISQDEINVGLVGYLWEPAEDKIKLDIKPLYLQKAKRGKLPPLVTGDVKEALAERFTRRVLAGKVAGVYDPIGIVTPITARLKLDLATITKLELGWDDLIPDIYLQTWVENLSIIQELKDVAAPRNVLHDDAITDKFELLVCCDASEMIAVAAVYARCKLPDNTFSCQLITAKSKLVNKCTVPKAELKAAKMGASLGFVVKRILGERVEKCLFVTDSSITLFWIHQDQRPLQVGVRNSVIEIRRLTDCLQWRHVDSELNPADIGTRRANISDISPDSDWFNGKDWMRLPEEKMPLRKIDELTLTMEQRRLAQTEIRNQDGHGLILLSATGKLEDRLKFTDYIVDPMRYRWSKFRRLFCLVWRCVSVWRGRAKGFKSCNNHLVVSLDNSDYEEADKVLFRKTTKELEYFNDWNKIKNLGEMKGGIFYYTGRILDNQPLKNVTNVMLDLDPITFVKPVVDRFSPISYSVLTYCHSNLTHHGGAISTLRTSRGIIYCLKGRELAIEIREACNFCRRYKARMIKAELGKLHDNRLTVAPAFYFTQVDLFGPMTARCEHNHRSTVKVWGAVFKCTATMAVAVQCMQSYSTQAFVQAYTRFSSRYGHPAKLYVDEGSQLMKACRDMELSIVDITKTLNAKFQVGLEFESCPVGGHNMHGMVERSIKEIRRIFNNVFQGLRLDILSFETAFCWVANEINSLPMWLGSKYENLENTDLITPARLIFGRNNSRALVGCPSVAAPGQLIQQMEDVATAWWTVWRDEKLMDFIPRPTLWRESDSKVLVGDIVVFLQDGDNVLNEGSWRLGRVVKANPGRDGVVRRIEIEYKNIGETVYRVTSRSVRNVAVICTENFLDQPSHLSLNVIEADAAFNKYFVC